MNKCCRMKWLFKEIKQVASEYCPTKAKQIV